MEISANFAFLKREFPHVAESASLAERHVHGDPRASCFHARHALERLVKRIYRVDKALSPPKTQNLDNYLAAPAFRELMPDAVWLKAEYIRQAGNAAVHGNKTPAPEKALGVVRELAHVVYWAGRTYLRKGAEDLQGRTFDESLVPKVAPAATPASIEALERVRAERDAAEGARKEVESELEALRERLAAIKAENEAVPETHDWNEDETRRRLIDLALQRAGWPLDQQRDREYKVKGMPNASGIGYADYVLWGDDGRPLAVVEAKRTTVDPEDGKQQAKLYADCLEQMHGQRPVIFCTNGYETILWDDAAYPPRDVAGFYEKDELASLIHRRAHRRTLSVADVRHAIADRYYQKRAIGSIAEQFAQARRKALLVMATGTGKTRTAVALVDLLQRAGWVKRTLFLADRVALVNQAVGAFKAHLPESSPVNLVAEKDGTGRVHVCTYPTMMGLIDETDGERASFGVGHYDLVIIDEAHRSVYQKYGAIFEHFDALLVGLTATPREQVDRNTYTLFDLEPGVPTDAYELETAVRDGFLVPPRVQRVDLKFPRDGIDYDALSDEEKAQWESLDWGDDVDPNAAPDRVPPAALNVWLFNTDTIDKMLQYLMENGHRVEDGDRLAKTIVFARNHEHARFIEERFNHHYPHYKGRFARVIDHYEKFPQSSSTRTLDKMLQYLENGHRVEDGDRLAKTIVFARNHACAVHRGAFNHHYPHYKGRFARVIDHYEKFPQSLLDDFSRPDEAPHIAISVDMLDTGIDVPEVANLVFCKPVYSKIKFWQMIGRGTRLCPELFGPGADKRDFRVFDFCFNFDFFREHPAGVEASTGASLGALLFRSRVRLLAHLQATPDRAPDGALARSLTSVLHGEVAAMNRDNFTVRMRLKTVDRFRKPEAWAHLSDDDRERLQNEVAGLPSAIEADAIESRYFDLMVLTMQLARVDEDVATFERWRKRVVKMAEQLEEKRAIPAVQAQLEYLAAVQEPGFWEGIGLDALEDLRVRVRALAPLLDRQQRRVIYTRFVDEIRGVRDEHALFMPTMTSAEYEKRVRAYLDGHQNHLVIHRLRTNRPLTDVHLKELESTLVEIGEGHGETLLAEVQEQRKSPSLAHFVRSLVGLDRAAAQAAFSEFLGDRSLTSPQIRFVEMVIDQLTARGVMDASALYERPFSDLNAGGPEALFSGRENIVEGIFEALRAVHSELRAKAS